MNSEWSDFGIKYQDENRDLRAKLFLLKQLGDRILRNPKYSSQLGLAAWVNGLKELVGHDDDQNP